MEKYETVKDIGSGNFGVARLMRHKETKELVAMKYIERAQKEKIVEEGGLDALLMLLRSSHNTTILRVASGAVANLAMNERNQSLITSNGGARLLASTASGTDDPQTLRMVAGAIANLCGNERLHVMLRDEGSIKALFGMVRTGNNDVIAQVARGIAKFAKCESRGIIQGHRRGHSLLIEHGVLTWTVANSNIASASTRHHIELAICHLAQNADNSKDFVLSGGLKELIRISTVQQRRYSQFGQKDAEIQFFISSTHAMRMEDQLLAHNIILKLTNI